MLVWIFLQTLDQQQLFTEDELKEFENHISQQEDELRKKAEELQKQKEELQRQHDQLQAQKQELQQVHVWGQHVSVFFFSLSLCVNSKLMVPQQNTAWYSELK